MKNKLDVTNRLGEDKMNKIKYSLVCCALLSSINLSAIDLKQGWNLVSLSGDFNTSQLTNENIKSIWSYDGNWSAYSSDDSYNKLLKDNNITTLNKINSSQGVWIQTTSKTTTPSVTSSMTNDINITKGWNLIGSIEDYTPLNAIDPNALYWKYNGDWLLGANKTVDSNITQFSTIQKNDGVWIYSASDHIYKEDIQKKFLFLDENLIPQKVSFDDKNASLDGYIHSNYKGDFDFNNSGFVPFTAGFENNELVSEYASGESENYALFLEDNTNQVSFENNGTDYMKVPYFSLPDYFLNFEDIKFIAIEAKPIKPLLMSANVIMILSNVNMKQSLTLSFTDIDSSNDFTDIGTFIKGVSTKVQGSDKENIVASTIDGQMNLKPIFKNISNVTNPYIYALNGTNWELVGPAYISKYGSAVSKNWYNKFTSYALVDVDTTNMYNHSAIIKNEQGQVLRDVLVVSDNKIAVSTNKDGNFTYTAPSMPKKLVAYKQGYQPLILDMNSSNSVIIKPLQAITGVSGLNGKFDKDFNTIYTIGDKNKEFTYIGTDYTMKPQLLADTDYIIYSTVYPYNDGYVFGASNAIISKIESDGNITKVDEGKGIIYDGMIVENNTLYYGTFGDNFTLKNNDTNNTVDQDDFGYELDLAVVYKPIVTSDKIYIPTYNQDINVSGSLIVSDLNNTTEATLSNVGTPGKLSHTSSDIVFGRSDSKVVFIDKTSNTISKNIDFGGAGIIAKVVALDSNYFAIDLNGLLKNLDTNNSIQLTPSSNLIVSNSELIVADHNGTIYHLNSSFTLNRVDTLDGTIVAEPIVYGSDIYTITSNGKFYKNKTLIGTFNTKVSNMNLVEDSIVFGCENGMVWKVKL